MRLFRIFEKNHSNAILCNKLGIHAWLRQLPFSPVATTEFCPRLPMTSSNQSNYSWNTVSLISCIYVGIPIGMSAYYEKEKYPYIHGAVVSLSYWMILRLSHHYQSTPLKAFAIGSILGALPIATIYNKNVLYGYGPGFESGDIQFVALAMMLGMSLLCGILGCLGALFVRYSNLIVTIY